MPVLQVQQVSLCQHEEGGSPARESPQDSHQATFLPAPVLALPLTFPPPPPQPPVLLLKLPAPHQVLPAHPVPLPFLPQPGRHQIQHIPLPAPPPPLHTNLQEGRPPALRGGESDGPHLKRV